MRSLTLFLVAAVVLPAALAGCASPPAAEVEPGNTNAVEGVEVVSRATASGPNGTTAPTAPGTTVPPAVRPTIDRLHFASPVALPLVGNIGGGEPNIAALADGTLFVTSPSGGQFSPNAQRGAAYLWRSQDNGTTWEPLREPAASPILFDPMCSCDADVVTSPDGWVYYSDWWLALVAGNYLVERSNDGGDTWTSTSITTREALAGRVDRQWLVAGEDGFLALFYSYFSPLRIPDAPLSELVTGVHVVTSHDHGATWGDPSIVVAPASGHDLQIAHARMLADGTLIMPYGDVANDGSFWRDPSQVTLAVSNDQGATWRQLPVADAPNGFDNLWAVQADVDASGAVHVAWAARVDDQTMATYVATSRDLGATWTTPLALRTTGLNFLPWITTRGTDTVAVGWYGGDATGALEDAKGDWFAYVAQSRDGGDTFAVQKVDDTPVKVGKVCPKGASCGGDRELLDYVSLVYDATGALHFAFARSEDRIALTMVASAPAGETV